MLRSLLRSLAMLVRCFLPSSQSSFVRLIVYSVTEDTRHVLLFRFDGLKLWEREEKEMGERGTEETSVDVLMFAGLGLVDLFTARAVKFHRLLVVGFLDANGKTRLSLAENTRTTAKVALPVLFKHRVEALRPNTNTTSPNDIVQTGRTTTTCTGGGGHAVICKNTKDYSQSVLGIGQQRTKVAWNVGAQTWCVKT